MMNLNDTISAFRCCVQIPPDCANCPQQGPGFGVECRNDVKLSVFHWLKAQIPRVMTLEELDAAPSGYVVLQTHDMPDMLEWYDGLLFSVNVNWTVDIITLEGKKRLRKDDYGIKWHCWTSRPTDEQREAVKWDATD